MTGQTFTGVLEFEAKGKAWKVSHESPAFANVIPQIDGLLVVPTDLGGGLRGGDSWTQSVKVCNGAQVTWKPPSCTLVHADVAGRPTKLEQSVFVGKGCRLDYLSKAFVPCAGAFLEQNLRIELESGCDALILDWWTLGRLASGESGQFLQVKNLSEVYFDKRLIWKESWDMKGGDVQKGLAVLAGNGMWMNILSCGDASHSRAQALTRRLEAQGGWASSGELTAGLRLTRLFSSEWIDF